MVEDGDQVIGLIPAVNHFYIFAVCVSLSDRGRAITQGFQQLAIASAERFYRTLHRLTVMDQTSSVLEDIRRRYHKALPHGINFADLPSWHTTTMIDALIRRAWSTRPIWCGHDRPSDYEHIRFAQDIAELSRAEYRRERELPKWILDFAFDSLSLDPLPSASIVANCFEITAINLGCGVSDTTTSEGRYISFGPIHIRLLTTS